MSTFPFELIEDILRRLHVKSLKRFRAVAKSWCFLIDSDDFVKLHLRHSLASNSHRHLILGGLGLYRVDLDSLDKAHIVKPPFYYKSVDGISNSCNGLVLVLRDEPVIWNPFSADYRVLPSVIDEHPPESYSKLAYGFAYDSENDDYKVVRVVEFRNNINHSWISSDARIYGLKSNSWRKIEGFPYPLPVFTGNWRVHVNGALHTLVEDPDNIDSAIIMAFSVQTEKHYPLTMPQTRIRGLDVSLDVVGGSLSVVSTNGHRNVVWVMKEYGVKESWVKLLSISPPALEPNDMVKPLAYSRDGDKVLLNCDDKRLVWYDLLKKTVEIVNVDGMPFVFYAEFCVESLVPLRDRDEVKKQRQEKKKDKIRNKRTNVGTSSQVSDFRRDDFLSEGFKLVL